MRRSLRVCSEFRVPMTDTKTNGKAGAEKPLVVQNSSGMQTDAKTDAKLKSADNAIVRCLSGFDAAQWSLDQSTKKPVKRELAMWYTPPADGTAPDAIVPPTKLTADGRLVPADTCDLGALHWCDRKTAPADRLSHVSHVVLPLDSLAQMYFGKRIQIFAAMAVGGAGGTIPEDRCFSCISQGDITLSAEALSADDVTAVSTLVQTLCARGGKKVLINHNLPAGGVMSASAADAGNAVVGAKPLAVQSITIKARKALVEVDPRLDPAYVIDKNAIAANNEVTRLARDGLKVTVYEMGPNRQARKKNAVLYYDISAGRIGSLVCTIPAVFNKIKELIAESEQTAQTKAAPTASATAPSAPVKDATATAGSSGSAATSAAASSSSSSAGAADAKASSQQSADSTNALLQSAAALLAATESVASSAAMAELELGTRPDTVVIDCDQLTRLFTGKQSQLLLNPIAQTAPEAACFSLIGNKTLVSECSGDASGAPINNLLLPALRHIVPFAKKEVVLEPLKDKFQPQRKSFAVSLKKPPKDSDDEGGDEDEDGGGGDD